MFKRIIVPVDGSTLAEQAIPYVEALGKALNTSIELVRVEDAGFAEDAAGPEVGQGVGEIQATLRAAAGNYLEQVSSAIRKNGLTVSNSIESGSPASTIVAKGEKNPDALLAMATHGRSGIGRLLMGSVTESVLHTTISNMLICRCKPDPGSPVAIKHLIVPLDGSETAAQALPVAAGLAKGLGADIILVRVVPRSQSREQYIEQSEMANRYFEDVKLDLSREGVVDVNDRTLMGEVAPAILDMSQEIADCLVVMTHKGHSAGREWVLGSVADKVIRSSAKPILLVHVVSDS